MDNKSCACGMKTQVECEKDCAMQEENNKQ